jgi:phosphoglycolate phosphatase-like HAD superfamily hydrolase
MSNLIQELAARGYQPRLDNHNLRIEAGLFSQTLALALSLPDLQSIPPGHHQALKDALDSHALLFDLDDTLVDTSKSFDATVQQLTGCTHQELQDLRAEGGFNDDWLAAAELLKRQGRPRPLEDVQRQGRDIYTRLAVQNEPAYFTQPWLEHWKKRHRLFIFTGRTREEYAPIWGARLDPHFTEVLCLGEHGFPGKPSPEGLQYLIQKHRLQGGLYVGNSVDDMRAAKAAGLTAIGITTNQSAATLTNAGADHIITQLDQLV